MKRVKSPIQGKKQFAKQKSLKQIFKYKGLPHRLFSPKRVEGFGGALAYQSHLNFTQEIIPLIQSIEIILRNKIDAVMKTHSPTWLLDLYFLDFKFFRLTYGSLLQDRKEIYDRYQSQISNELKKIFKQEKLDFQAYKNNQTVIQGIDNIHERLLSKVTLGFWISIFLNNDFKHFDLHSKIFPKLFNQIKQNQIHFWSFIDLASHPRIKRDNPNHRDRVLILVSFMTSIRNRALHWENLFKINQNGNKRYSSIATSFVCANKNKPLYITFRASKNNIKKYLEKILEDLLEVTTP